MKSKFAQFAAERSRRMFLGELLKYRQGAWEAGMGGLPVSASKPFVAVMGSLTVGFLKWTDNRPSDFRWASLRTASAPLIAAISAITTPITGRPTTTANLVDPWQATTLIVLIGADPPHDLFTFSTSTIGGSDAIGALSDAHSRTTQAFGQYPVVTLGSDSYQHRILSRGKVKVPVFNITRAVEAAPFDAMIAEARGGAVFSGDLRAWASRRGREPQARRDVHRSRASAADRSCGQPRRVRRLAPLVSR
jgi:hypothetical protein